MSRGHLLCGFVPMQGIGAHTERLVLLDGEKVVLRVDGPDKLDADRLQDALFQPKVERWSGVEVGGFEPFDELDLWLATVVDDFGFDDYPAAEHIGVAHIGPEMTRAETAGLIASWFFIRKAPSWHLRFLPSPDSTEQDATNAAKAAVLGQ